MAANGSPELTSFIVSASSMSDAGCVRESNEDYCTVVHPADPDVFEHKGVLIVVADGVGGSQAGEVASRAAVECITRSYYESSEDPHKALARAFEEANQEIYRLSQLRSDFIGMGTTGTALALRGQVAYSAHVGDSRLYLVRSRSIYQMTEDHSIVKELVKQGTLTPEEARHHPDRNLIFRALGNHATVKVASWEQALPVRVGDCFVLCSDGLYDTVTDDEICEAAQQTHTAAACEVLVSTARLRGGRDNITVAIARVDG
jgi:protein phosphatase